MKKPQPAGRGAKRGAQGGPKNVREYLAALPKPARSALRRLRAAIRSAVPSAATEVISYRIPAFAHQGTRLWFAAFSNHCSLFPTASVVQQFKDELKDFATSKGTIQFTHGTPLPMGLIRKLVQARFAGNEGKDRRRLAPS